jgi:uncharacterized repeat protein (TIGR02543 family)
MKKAISYISIVALCLTSLACFASCEQEQESEYTITFYNNRGIYFFRSSGDGEEHISIHYQDDTVYKVETFSGIYISEPTPPTNEGYVFLGWYQNPECTIEFVFGHYEINSDINLYAKWSKGR